MLTTSGVNYATRAVLSKPLQRVSLGAAILKGKKVLSTGTNNENKTSPKAQNITKRLHAEFDALRHNKSFEGATIYVVRIKKDGSYGMAKPCKHCVKLCRKAGIKKVFYSTQNGIEWERI